MSIDITNEDGTLNYESAKSFLQEFNEEEKKELEQEKKQEESKKQNTENGESDENSRKPFSDNEDKTDDDEKSDSGNTADDGDGDEFEWLTSQDVTDFAKSFGLSEDQLKEFSGRDEFDRHVALLDKQFLNKADESQRAIDAQKQKEQQEAERKSKQASEQYRENGKFAKEPIKPFEVQLEDEFNDDSVIKAEFQRMTDYYEERIKSLEDSFFSHLETIQKEQEQAWIDNTKERFDSAVDRLNMSDVFNTSENLIQGSKEWNNRSKLWNVATQLMLGMQASGKNANMNLSLVKRAFNQEFADLIKQKRDQEFSKKVKNQSKRTLSGGKGSTPKDVPYKGPMEENPKLLKAYDDLLKEGK